jgi:hypothetical protein
MNKSPKKPETFIPHQQKAVRILTEIQKINKKYVSLVKPRIEKEISSLLNKNKPDEKALSLLSKLLKAPGVSNSISKEEVQSIENIIDEKLKKINYPRTDKLTLFLSGSGDLYWGSKKGHCYPVENGSIRYKILFILRNKDDFYPTKKLRDETNTKKTRSIRDSISHININAEKFLSISNTKSKKLIVSKIDSGYKINDLYNILKA